MKSWLSLNSGAWANMLVSPILLIYLYLLMMGNEIEYLETLLKPRMPGTHTDIYTYLQCDIHVFSDFTYCGNLVETSSNKWHIMEISVRLQYIFVRWFILGSYLPRLLLYYPINKQKHTTKETHYSKNLSAEWTQWQHSDICRWLLHDSGKWGDSVICFISSSKSLDA